MALKFSVSAPGKVILSGEHSVVYGKAAVAGVIGLRNTLELEATSPHELRLEFDLFPQPCTIAIIDFNELLVQLNAACSGPLLPATVPHERFVSLIGEFLGAGDRCPRAEGPHTDDDEFRRTCLAAVYLLAGALCSSGSTELRYGFVLRFRSGLAKGAGLGSSASFGVCLAAAFHVYASYRFNPNCIKHFNDAAQSVNRAAALEQISAWAFCSERLMHGNPSGLDNTICTHGQLVKFYKQQKPTSVAITVPLQILLINSGVSRSTRVQVEKVAALRTEHPAVLDAIMQALESVVEDMLPMLTVTAGAGAREQFSRFGRLVTLNNNLLGSIGVSHDALDRITLLCKQHGVASKLTGAGGGGYAFAVLPPEPLTAGEAEQVQALCEALAEAGFEWHRTSVGGDGVLIEEQTNG